MGGSAALRPRRWPTPPRMASASVAGSEYDGKSTPGLILATILPAWSPTGCRPARSGGLDGSGETMARQHQLA